MLLLSPNSEQLELDLDDVRVRVPWEGRSPRGLTRGANLFIFETQGDQKHARSRVSAQLDLFQVTNEGPPVYRGAPLLLPLLEGD